MACSSVAGAAARAGDARARSPRRAPRSRSANCLHTDAGHTADIAVAPVLLDTVNPPPASGLSSLIDTDTFRIWREVKHRLFPTEQFYLLAICSITPQQCSCFTQRVLNASALDQTELSGHTIRP